MKNQALSEISKYCFEKKKTIEALMSVHYQMSFDSQIRADEFREVLKSQQIIKIDLIIALTDFYNEKSRGASHSGINIRRLDEDISIRVRRRHELIPIFKKLLKKMSIGKNQLFKNLEAVHRSKTADLTQITQEFHTTGCGLNTKEQETIKGLYDYEENSQINFSAMKDDFCTYLNANGERYEEILKVKKFDDDVSNYWGRKIFINVHKYLLNHEYANCEEFWRANGMNVDDYSISSWEFQENINKLDKTITNSNVQKLYEEIIDVEMKACSIKKFLEIYGKVTESMTDRQDELKKADFTNEEEKRTLKNQNRIFSIIADALDKAGQSLEKLLEQERYQKYQKTIPKINFGCFLQKIAVSLSDFPDEEVDQVFFQPRDPQKSNFIQYDMTKLIYFVNGRNKVVPKGISDPSNKDLSDLMTQLLSVVNPILIEALMDEKKPNDGF